MTYFCEILLLALVTYLLWSSPPLTIVLRSIPDLYNGLYCGRICLPTCVICSCARLFVCLFVESPVHLLVCLFVYMSVSPPCLLSIHAPIHSISTRTAVMHRKHGKNEKVLVNNISCFFQEVFISISSSRWKKTIQHGKGSRSSMQIDTRRWTFPKP